MRIIKNKSNEPHLITSCGLQRTRMKSYARVFIHVNNGHDS